MPMDPNYFDEEVADKHEYDLSVLDILSMYSHINKGMCDAEFKRTTDFWTGIENYRAKASVTHGTFTESSFGDTDQEFVRLCIGQDHDRQMDIADGNDTTKEHADTHADLTPEQARELASYLEEYAEKVEEINQGRAKEEAEEVLKE